MIIRKANNDDIPAIISVLKAGLGEGVVKKNTNNWLYKHVLNPFGKSIVFVAETDNKIVGVRAFMQWQWQKSNNKFTAWRAVDTATHPDYQRRGIFKQLTLRALKEAEKYPDSFIFNTPNQNSKPGYLKLGWKPVNKIPVTLIPTFVYPGYYSNKKFKLHQNWEQIENICQKHNEKQRNENKFFTPKSTNYLKWRYSENPIQEYHFYSDHNLFIAYYTKKHRFFNELRVSEIIGDLKSNQKLITELLLYLANKNKCSIISTSQKNLFNISISGNFGPELVVHPLKNNSNFVNSILNIRNWTPVIGDLELF